MAYHRDQQKTEHYGLKPADLMNTSSSSCRWSCTTTNNNNCYN